MLIFNKKLSFSEGRISFYDQDISVYPLQSIIEYMGLIHKDQELTKFTYITAKESILEYKQNLINSCNQSNKLDWAIQTINLYGLGKVQYNDSTSFPAGKITIENSPFVQNLKGKVNSPVDHILRGIVSGVISSIFDTNYDVIELDCSVAGATNCSLAINTKDTLLKKFPTECKIQIV